MVRDFGAKLRITAAALGCASQKDLCARFREVNAGTIFQLDRSYKWMQGRALPRSVRLYEDWAALLGTGRSIAWLQSCTLDEFLDLLCGRFEVSRDALATRAGIAVAVRPSTSQLESREAVLGRRLAGVYACYSHAWSPYFEGMIIRGRLTIEAAPGAPQTLLAAYAEKISLDRIEVRGQVAIAGRSVHVELAEPIQFRLAMSLFSPGTLASVLAGVMSGISWIDADSKPAASRVLLIRIPGATAATLVSSNRYLSLAEEPFSSELAALGLRVAEPAELDALLGGFWTADRPGPCIKVGPGEYSRLGLAIDRLFIDSGVIAAPTARRA